MENCKYFIATIRLLVITVLVGACTAPGSQEFQLYSDAYDAQYTQGDKVLSALAKAERVMFERIATRKRASETFDPNDAAYYVNGVEPPITASIRATLKAVKDYNDAMAALANGERAAALSNRIATLTSSALGAVSATSVASQTPDNGLGTQALAAKTGGLLAALPFVKQAITIASREAFRRRLIHSYPLMEKLLKTLRDEGTPVMFRVLKQGRRERGMDARAGLTEAGQAALNEDRALLAGWVLLLDKTLVTLKAAKTAAENGSAINLANLNNAAIELRVLAAQVKQ